jgi:hypothetical protein
MRNYIVKKVQSSNLLIAILINSLFLSLIFLFCDVKYEVSDDFVMAAILSGAYGNGPNPQMVFVNVIIGYLLLPFYKLFPEISWYFMLQLFLIFISSCAVTYFLFEKLEKPKAIMLSVIFILFFSNDAYILLQFTKTAMFAVMAGSLLFIWALFYKKSIWNILAGAILCLMGTMMRFPDIYLAGGFLLFILGYEFVRICLGKGPKGLLEKRVLFILFAGCTLIGSAYGIRNFNNIICNDDENYRQYYAYNGVRSGVVDAPEYGYEEMADELSEIGVSENDYYMMRSWNFADNDFFTYDRMQKTAEIIARHHSVQEVGKEEIFERLQEREYLKYPVFLACILLLGLGVFLNYPRWWTMLISMGIGEFYLIYFCYRERYVYRVEYSVFLGMFMCGIYFWTRRGFGRANDSERTDQKRGLLKICAVITSLCMMIHLILYIPDRSYQEITSEGRMDYITNTFYESWNYGAQKYRKVVNKGKPPSGLLEEFSANKDNFYFLDFQTTIQILYYEWYPWENVDAEKYDNFSYLAGITTNYPDLIKLLKKKGVENPLKSLVDEEVYLVDNRYLEIKLNYLREHYYPDARVELYKEIDGYQIWKFYKE